MDKEIKKVQSYVINFITYEDGSSEPNRTNDGFNSMELLGLLSMTQIDIIDQIEGKVKPTIITRNLIKDKE